MMQPPARRAAIGVMLGRLIVEDVDTHHRPSLGSVVKRRIISQPQIAPQPYELGHLSL